MDLYRGKISSFKELADFKANSFSINTILNYADELDYSFADKNDVDFIKLSEWCNDRKLPMREQMILIPLLLNPYLTMHAINETNSPFFNIYNNEFKNLGFIFWNKPDKIALEILYSKDIEHLLTNLYVRSSLSISHNKKAFENKFYLNQKSILDFGYIAALMTLDKSYILQDIIQVCAENFPLLKEEHESSLPMLKYIFIIDSKRKLNPALSFCKLYTGFSFNTIETDFSRFSSIFDNWNKKMLYRDRAFRKRYDF